LSFECKIRNSAGKTKSVKIVEKITPPITTVANGLCTSEPIPVFNAIGIKPSEATRAVVITGLNLVTAPSIIALSSNCGFGRKAYGEFIASFFAREIDSFVLNYNGNRGRVKLRF